MVVNEIYQLEKELLVEIPKDKLDKSFSKKIDYWISRYQSETFKIEKYSSKSKILLRLRYSSDDLKISYLLFLLATRIEKPIVVYRMNETKTINPLEYYFQKSFEIKEKEDIDLVDKILEVEIKNTWKKVEKKEHEDKKIYHVETKRGKLNISIQKNKEEGVIGIEIVGSSGLINTFRKRLKEIEEALKKINVL